MEKSEIVSKLTPIFRDVFGNDALVVTDGLTATDVPTWDSAFKHQHDYRCREGL